MEKEKATEVGFVRRADAPILPPPFRQVGLVGWLWQNVFASFLDFSSLGNSVKSCIIGLFTIAVLYFQLVIKILQILVQKEKLVGLMQMHLH